MKKVNLLIGIIAMICFAFGFSACEKDADFQKMIDNPECSDIDMNIDVDETKGSNSYFSWTYFPDTSYSYSYSIAGENELGYGDNTYNGGFMHATLVQYGGNYYVRMTPALSSTFLFNGTAYVKVGSLYGDYGSNYASFNSTDTYVDVPVTITLNQNNTSKRGVMNLWPVIFTSNPLVRFFTHPILISTNPLYYSTNTTYTIQGYVDNVYLQKLPGGCVNFCKRYYEDVYGMNLWGMHNACDWWTEASNFGLTTYSNGTTIPKVGDIVCWTGGTGDFANLGHVAIIYEVLDDRVRLAQQGSINVVIGREMNRSGSDGKTLSNILGNAGYTLKGVIRKSGT